MHVRAGALRHDHVLGDLLAHGRHGHDFARSDPADRLQRNSHCRRSRRRRGRRATDSRSVVRRELPNRSARAMTGNERLDVFFGNAAAKPVAGTLVRSTLFSLAMRRTSGLERTRSCSPASGIPRPFPAVAAPGRFSRRARDRREWFACPGALRRQVWPLRRLGLAPSSPAAALAGAGADAGAAAASPSAAMVPTTVLTCTVVPACTLMSCNVPGQARESRRQPCRSRSQTVARRAVLFHLAVSAIW